MPDKTDYMVEKLQLLGRAKEDAYFRQLDQELIDKLHEERDAPEAEHPDELFETILVAVDFSEHSRDALHYAAGIAERCESSMIILHVIDQAMVEIRLAERHPLQPFLVHAKSKVSTAALEKLIAEQREKAYEELQRFVPSRLARYPVELRVLVGRPFERVVETAESENASLIVMGTHGRTGVSRWVTGSIAERVVRFAGCPVLTVKQASSDQPAEPPSG